MSYNLTNLTLRELRCLRKSLDCIPIKGIDALFVANLQGKLDAKIINVEQIEENQILPPPGQ
tara:strand:+ start:507 stop:692 length:186 start_codon:yes stop_codon:yes gene_type:complete